MTTPEPIWVVDPTDKFPEWLEFNGRRYPCKLTPKGITMDTGETRHSWTRKGGSKQRRVTFRYDTSVPEYGEGSWYGIHAQGMYDPFHDAPYTLDSKHAKGSSHILVRLLEVQKAEAILAQKEAEERAIRDNYRAKQQLHTLWYKSHRPIQAALEKAIRDGNFDQVGDLAQQLHASWQQEPSVT